MKSNLVLCFVAALGFAVANVQAQEASVAAYAGTGEVVAPIAVTPADVQPAVAPAVDATQTVVSGNCQECQGGVAGIGGMGLGRFGGGMGGLRARMESAAAERAERIGRERQIVQASPYAYPTGAMQDWARFRNYPYGYYPHNFGPSDMRIPGYNPAWQNYYPTARRYHEGKHFNLDVF